MRWPLRRPLVSRRHLRLAAFAAIVLATVPAGPATAAETAEVQRMIEALSTASAPGRTRNIVVRQRTDAADTPQDVASAALAVQAKAIQPASLTLPIVFEPNSARLRPESGAALGALTAALLAPTLREQRFLIEGHTDAAGSGLRNERLSLERAEEVRLYLVTLGVPRERLEVAGRGASELLRPDAPHSPDNRRVRVVALP